MRLFYLTQLASILLVFATDPAFAADPPASDTPEARLAARGWTLPAAPAPIALYRTWVRTGNLLFVAGHGECGETLKSGKVGRDLTIEEGQRSAERVALCVLATVKAALGGDLGRVRQAVRILGMVNAPEDFTEHPKVINGFSEVLRVAFGDAGIAARAAVGMQSLPSNIPVEVEAVFEIAPQ